MPPSQFFDTLLVAIMFLGLALVIAYWSATRNDP